MEEAIKIARQYVGEVYSVKLKLDRFNNQCYYHVKGEKGFVMIDAESGKEIR